MSNTDYEHLNRLKQQALKSTKAYDQRMKDKGFVKKHLWVPKERGDELCAIAEEMRRNAK